MTTQQCASDGCDKPVRKWKNAKFCSLECRRQTINARVRAKSKSGRKPREPKQNPTANAALFLPGVPVVEVPAA